MPNTFLDLQNGFYNALSQGLGFPPNSPFQMLQPSPPVLNQTQLWNYFNLIPLASLTNDYLGSGGSQFFDDYKGLLSALQGPPNTFAQDVGAACNAAWNTYLNILPITTPLGQLPSIFQRWAILHGYSSVANKGASDLAQIVLDPIAAAQITIGFYLGNPPTTPPTPPNWDQGYTDMTSQLGVAPSRSFDISSSNMNFDVKNTWCQGNQSAFFGLWSNSSSSSSESVKFAASAVTVKASFQHVLPFTAVPGAWYSSSAMGDAFSHESGPPWISASTINWTNTFSSTQGNMARFASNIIVVSGMSITVQSMATFTQAEQTTISHNESVGMWPFYSSNSNSGTHTGATFTSNGNMTVTITSQAGVPIVIGVDVVPVSTYVGHAVEGAKLYAAALTRHRR